MHSSRDYNGPFRAIAASKMLFHLSLSNVAPISNNRLTFKEICFYCIVPSLPSLVVFSSLIYFL